MAGNVDRKSYIFTGDNLLWRYICTTTTAKHLIVYLKLGSLLGSLP